MTGRSEEFDYKNLTGHFTSDAGPLEFLFHNIVQNPVDNHVDRSAKRAIIRLLHRIA